jgi:hypothetical protein
MQDLPPEIVKAAPSVIGAAASAAFSKEHPVRAFFMFVVGSAVGYIMQAPASEMLGVHPVITGVFIGVFGIPVIGKGLEVLQSLPLAQLAQQWLQRWITKD